MRASMNEPNGVKGQTPKTYSERARYKGTPLKKKLGQRLGRNE